jgi:hypothetical protein
MVRLFSPCTRFRDIIESQGRRGSPEHLREANLDVSTEELLSAERAFSYADLYAISGSETTVLWLTSHAAVIHGDERVDTWVRQLDRSYHFCFSADGKHIIALAHSHEHLSEICNVIARLLVASVVHSVHINKWSYLDDALIKANTLVYLMEQCQSLKVLTLVHLEMNEDQIRVLDGYSRPGLEIVLKN